MRASARGVPGRHRQLCVLMRVRHVDCRSWSSMFYFFNLYLGLLRLHFRTYIRFYRFTPHIGFLPPDSVGEGVTGEVVCARPRVGPA